MKQAELVSIVVPVYNAEAFLANCIDSIKAQTYQTIEIILIDDGSKDRSAEICREYARLDSRIRYIRQENGGVAAARNHGLRQVTGSYVLFVDSDDRLVPDAVETMVQAMEEADCDLVISGYSEEYADRQVAYEIEPVVISGGAAIGEYYGQHYLQSIASTVWAKLYKKELIHKEFQENISMGEDFLFNIDYFRGITSLAGISKPLYLYNQTNENSLVRNYKEAYFRQNLYVCQYAKDWLSGENSGVSLLNIQAKIAYSFFEYLFFLVEKETAATVKDKLKDILDSTVQTALYEAEADSIGVFRKGLARLLLQKQYGLAIFLTKLYLKLHG